MNELPKRFNAADAESRWCEEWAESGIYAWDPNAAREETFVVDTPPPTVSGSLHVGHLFSYSHQDFIVRYQRMRGKNVFFPIGWDDNGLPTERRVQNLYNVKCEPHLHYDPDFKGERGRKGDPLPISRRNFIELCDEAIKDDEAAFKHLWTRLGLSYDWDQEYTTINEHCRRTSQASFLELLEKGHAYQADQPVMWDVDFQTAIAQAELVDKEEASAYHFLRFGIQDSSEFLVIATTRPELLPACVAVFVHPEDDRFKAYHGKNAVTPLFHVPVPIIPDEKADPEKGTGVVMCCTFGDQTDVDWWREHNLPLRQVIARNGHLAPALFGEGAFQSLDPAKANEVYQQAEGQFVKKARKTFLTIAEELGEVIDRPEEKITHAVRFFEKGDRPLELIPTRQWYTRIMDKKDELIAQGRKIDWHPPFMIKRYESWVDGLNQDWCLSRQRYFGVPIPVWYECDENGEPDYDKRIVPAKDTLPIDPLDDAPPGYTDDQRDQPDGFTGDPDVFDTWATSSLSPQVASKWVDDPDRHKRLFPMDVRPQSHEIIRTWAFYTIVKAYLHENTVPWHNVVISGWILDPDRKKMSKSHGNVVTPEPLIDEFGADSVRYWSARARLGVDTAYDEQVFKVGKKLCTKLFNASKFAMGRFAEIDPGALGSDKITHELDRAVIRELRPTIERASQAFDAFDYAQALQLTEEFFWNVFCDNYLEMAKTRTYEEGLTPGRLSAASTLRTVHRAIVRMFAPFLPFIAEEIWSWAYSKDDGMAASIHRSPWPTLEELAAIPEPKSEKTFEASVWLADNVRKRKADQNLSIKAPVALVQLVGSSDALVSVQEALPDLEGMLTITTSNVVEGKSEHPLFDVTVEL
jgi:valyl-tRNA synthetase